MIYSIVVELVVSFADGNSLKTFTGKMAERKSFGKATVKNW